MAKLTTPRPDARAVIVDIAVDIEAAAMRAHEQLHGLHPYSMSSSQFKLAGLALQIASLSQQIRAEIAASYPPPPMPTADDMRGAHRGQ